MEPSIFFPKIETTCKISPKYLWNFQGEVLNVLVFDVLLVTNYSAAPEAK